MSIQNLLQKIKDVDGKHEIITILIIILVGIGGFGLGRLSTAQKENPPILISGIGANVAGFVGTLDNNTMEDTAIPAQGGYVASKNSDKYHLPWCSGAQRISEANKVWFSTKEEAEKAGYTPAGNCKGI